MLARARPHALDFIESLDSRSVAATAIPGGLRARLDRPLPSTGAFAETIIDDFVADAEGGHVGSASGRFFSWVIWGAMPASLAADWLAATWDNNAGAPARAPASCVVEEVAGAWLKEILDLLGRRLVRIHDKLSTRPRHLSRRGAERGAAARGLGCRDRWPDRRAADPGAGERPAAWLELLVMPTLKQGLLRFSDPASDHEAAHAARTNTVVATINATDECLFSGATWRGKRVMRISVVNWRTDADDVRRTIAAAAGILERMG